MKKFRAFLAAHWHHGGLIMLATLASCFVLLIHLGSLAPRLSPTELSTLAGSAHLHNILTSPLNLPLKILQWLSNLSPVYPIVSARLPSVLLGLVAIALFIYIARRWYGARTTMFGFIIFASSAWLLHVSRFAGTDIEYLVAILGLVAIHVGLHQTDRPWMLVVWTLTSATLLFIPGFVWFIILNAIWQRNDFADAWSNCRKLSRSAIITVMALAGAALAATFVWHFDLIRPWLGAPAQFGNWLDYVKSFGRIFLFIGYHGPHRPELWLEQLPLLDAFLSLMLIAGVIFYARHWQAQRSRLLLLYFLLGAALVSLGGAVPFSVVVPLIYLVAIGGIAYVLHYWLSVFPRNPLARGFGIGLVLLAIALSSFYNLRQYFTAWPHNTETQHIYRQTNHQ